MKKTLQLILLFSLWNWSVNAQNFIRVTQSDFQHQIKMAPDQALEVRLSSNPSTGFGWYPASGNAIVTQVGEWEFISDNPSAAIGSSGTQVTHFVSVAKGTTELELLYKRPWEDASQAIDSYKLTIVSDGAYTGKKIQSSIVLADESTLVLQQNETTRALPASFSWESQGLCTKVKNQSSCGSCWAFASCGSYESVIKIWDKVTRDLSEQWLVNCDKKASGCSGGWCPDYMFKNTGAVYETDLPYTAKNGTCNTYTYHEKTIGYKQIADVPTVAQIKQAIYDYGPVWACVCAGGNFSGYKTGVLTNSDGTSVNHAIVLCGWDDATGSWVLRNSWGTGWGEKSGYMRIKYGVSNVGYRATYFDYKGTVINHGVTSVSDLNPRSSAQVFPNPSSGEFTFSGLENNNTIEVYDFVGKKVYQTTSKSDAVTVDLKNKSQGVYFYKIINASTKEVETGKIMVY
jgi:C1A family cysteine protease